MEKKNYANPPMPPRTPNLPAVPETPGMPLTAATPVTPVTPLTPLTPTLPPTPGEASSMPSGSPPVVEGNEPAAKMPPMPKFPKLGVSTNMQNTTNFQSSTPMPDTTMEQFKMSKFFEIQMEHHRQHHLLPNGDCKPHLKEEGWKYYKKYRG